MINDATNGIGAGPQYPRPALNSGWLAAILTAAALLAGCAGGSGSTGVTSAPTVRPSAPEAPSHKPAAGSLDKVLRAGDRILFVGDDMTLDMFYSRAVACALLPLMPDAGLRFFNGGHEGGTARNALNWIDDLMDCARPTVVFLCFGVNDGEEKPVDQADITGFSQSLGALIDKVKARPGVRWVVVLGPPAVQRGIDERYDAQAYNRTLEALSRAAKSVADEKGVSFGDLFEHTHSMYEDATRQRVHLALGGKWPNECGHLVIASLILRGMGVTGEQLEEVGWSPLPPIDMRQVRQALAIKVKPIPSEQSSICRALYQNMPAFDEQFFRAWRLARRKNSSISRQDILANADSLWGQIQAIYLNPMPAHPVKSP